MGSEMCIRDSIICTILNYFPFSGVKVFEKVSVVSVMTDGKSITAVETNRGNIKCDILVNCAGQVLWTCC